MSDRSKVANYYKEFMKFFQIKINRSISSIIFTSILLIVLTSGMLNIFSADETGYTPLTKVCISCHNDTGYPEDTDNNSVSALYMRPHNNTIMCESCHLNNPHTVFFIRYDGLYGNRSSAASCPECHQKSMSNANFTRAPKVPLIISHADNVSNGSLWGSYWSGGEPKSSCSYCHGNTTHNKTPIGRILDWNTRNNAACSNCHYKGDENYSIMASAFITSGLAIPPEITNGTNWNGRYLNYFNHSFGNYSNNKCKQCHGHKINDNATMTEFVHNVSSAKGEECIGCHELPVNSSILGELSGIVLESFGSHINVNKSEGADNLSNSDCMTCHYNFSFSSMMEDGFSTLTYKCPDCHTNGNYSAPVISNHKPGGVNIMTSAYCSTCHNNSINIFSYSVNASVGHYVTNTSLIKPTVNQSSEPRFGFANSSDALSFNKPCNNCHNPSNESYGNATQINYPHTNSGTCNQCHVPDKASDLHNVSLRIPAIYTCKNCHINAAIGSQFGAPDISGTDMTSYSTCAGCHGGGDEIFDSLDDHNRDRTYYYGPKPGYTDTVYLNGFNNSLTVTRGAIVTITSRVNDSAGDGSKVGGAEYYIGTDPGWGRGIPMNATDGKFDSAKKSWENVNATIDTSSLSSGTYVINVRGMDIGKQWSQTKNATLIVQASGYINGIVEAGSLPVSGAYVSTIGANFTTGADGLFSMGLTEGTYTVNTSKQPEYYDNVTSGVIVTPMNTTYLTIVITGKPTGTLSGIVRRI